MQWNSSYQDSIFSFANNINTIEGGTHMQGFRSALTRTLNKYARDKGLLKEKEDNLEGEDIREGLAAVVSVKLQNPQFEGQTKTKLGNPPIAGLVESTVNAKLAEFLEENPTDAKQIVLKAVQASRARQAEVRLYDNLFTKPDPEDVPEGQDFTANLNPHSLDVVEHAKLEPSLAGAAVGSRSN